MKKKHTIIGVVLLALALLIVLTVVYIKKSEPFSPTKEFSEYVEANALLQELDPHLVYAVIQTESGFDVNALSEAPAYGLMQITEDTFEWLQTKTGETLAVDDLYRPDTNIRYGCLFLGLLQKEFGGEREILTAYFEGRGQLQKWLDDPAISADGKTLDTIPLPKTAHYVSKVQRAKERYDRVYGELGAGTQLQSTAQIIKPCL